jgi:hypothetical protein
VRRLPLLAPLLLAALSAAAAETHEVRFSPFFMEEARVQASRHQVTLRGDLSLDAFKAPASTETLDGLYTQARPALEYRYAPGAGEIFFRVVYSAQNVELTSPSGARVESRYSAGAGQPVVGMKLPFADNAALELHTALPTEAVNRTPRLGDGAHYGGSLLLRAGRWHWSAGHTARLAYIIHGATETVRRAPGGVTELAVARTAKDFRTAKTDFVGTLLELHGVYIDRERLDGMPVKGSSALSGFGVFGFVLGKINPGATHLTRVAVSVGFGGGLHKTGDPAFGVGDLRLMVGYGLYWGRRG